MNEDTEGKRKAEKKRKVFRGLLLTMLGCIFAGLCWLTWDSLSQNVWAYYTDESGMRVGVEEDKARFVLWEDPVGNPGNAGLENLEGTRLEATFSPNGTSMIIVRRDDNVSGTDMYLSQWKIPLFFL